MVSSPSLTRIAPGYLLRLVALARLSLVRPFVLGGCGSQRALQLPEQ